MSKRRNRILAIGLVACSALSSNALADPATLRKFPDWTTEQRPFQIVGNVYYVGSKGLAAFLIQTTKGLILLDGTLQQNADMIERNIRSLGFRLDDVKILLNSHAHYDHAGGLAQIKHDTGAKLYASKGDRWALEHGIPRGDLLYTPDPFPKVHVDRELGDGDEVRLGSSVLTAWLTPGHTPGCTTWKMRVEERGRALDLAIPCSLSVADNALVGNRRYPGIVADFRTTFAKLAKMHADVTLTAHPEVSDLLSHRREQTEGNADAFVVPGELQRIVTASGASFEAELERQERTAPLPAAK